MNYKINFDFSFLDVLKFSLVNLLLLVITFGLALPFVFFNTIQFITDNLEIMTKENFDKKVGKEF
ncbi:hypothetical protein PM10SUCC1_00420 [Propionigenium maris DSM 9537]|uniref:Uncharacterized protein n=1 Tax=Propionigenium maris DSM 9537 TaxID=1123000 RepID=A0A9W6LLC2_9FUSO|nr:hypothetical protein [Propionigenium maris]GLI54527.1 hypothetical protein PM10SUCC1_00420 [Propionigenium maris DSM 9537]